ncbi:MAG TPA: DNA modification methylase [Phycisphaerales bacterium]|nr:DNA modification methylase [Phycisphaerales bacterium]
MARNSQCSCVVTPRLRPLLVPLDKISADPANLRKHPESSIEAILASYRRFGQQKPIVVDARGVTIAGAGQLEAARRLGWTHIAAVRSNLTGVERVGYAIADNRSGEFSAWDVDALHAVSATLPDDVLASAGFTLEDIAALASDEDPTPEPAAADLAAAVSQHGDLWELGEHRLLCGDSTESGDVDRLMKKQKAALVATDPPYLVDYTGVRAGNRGKDWSGSYREVDVKDPARFFLRIFAQIVRVLAPHAAVYCWHAHKRIRQLLDAWDQVGLLQHQELVWIKPSPVFGSVFWHFRHEPCIMGWVQGSAPHHDGRQDHDSVWVSPGVDVPIEKLTRAQAIQAIKDMTSVWEADWGGKSRPTGNEHPTQKPVEIFARPIRKHTKPGDVCFEPFSGSGSQLIAAEHLGRRCFAMELEPVFVDAGIRRWEAFSGKKARLAGTRKTFEQVAKERLGKASVRDQDTAIPAGHARADTAAAVATTTKAVARRRRR